MPWALLISFAIGALCAARIPVLHFTVLVAAVMGAYASIGIATASPALNTVLWAAIYAVMLEAGYMFSHLLYYLIVVKVIKRDAKKPSSELRSRTSPD
jgi:hypothetical protein